MKSWKKRWMEEIDAVTPSLDDYVKNEPIPTVPDNNVYNTSKAKRTVNVRNKGFFVWVPAAIAAVVAICIGLGVLFKPADTPVSKAAMVTVEINPRASFSINADGYITDVVATNSDADVILSSEQVVLEIVGKTAEQGIKVFVDYAARLGYMDFSTACAIRVSVCGEGERQTLSVTEGELNKYFMEKGVYAAVVGEVQTPKDFAERSGLPVYETANEIMQAIAQMEVMFGARETEGKTIEQLTDIYKETFLNQGITDYYKLALTDNFEKIVDNCECLLNLSTLYSGIFNHPDNPAFVGDYWVVKNTYDSAEYTSEFSNLMGQMENALIEYEQKFGYNITSIIVLKDLAGLYEQFTISDITALIQEMGLVDLIENFAFIDKVLDNIGVDHSVMETLAKLPETVEEYISKVVKVLTVEFESKISEFSQAYEEIRPSVSESEHDSYINDIIGQYGSLEKYWSVMFE